MEAPLRPHRFDDDRLARYANGFLGYGSLSAPVWFIGMEEGGGDDPMEVERKVTAWNDRGQRELEDLWEFHQAVGIRQWFGANARIQTTWGKYSRLALSLRGGVPSQHAVRTHQARELGRAASGTCMLEVLPLPSPSIGVWHYGNWSQLPALVSRAQYSAHFLPQRAARLVARIEEASPRVVFITGLGLAAPDVWRHFGFSMPVARALSGKTFASTTFGGTLIVVMQHPAARGIANEYYESLAAWVSSEVGPVQL